MTTEQGQVVTLHVYVISLRGELARRQSVARQLDNTGLSWSFVDAIDYREVDVRQLWGEAELAAAQASYGRQFTPGEIACAESHYQTYRTLAQSDAAIGIILEDDFIASPAFFELLSELGQGAQDWFDLLFLGYSKLAPAAEAALYRFMPILPERSLANIRIGPVWSEWTYGNVAYAINHQAAERLTNMPRLHTIADNWEGLKKHYRLRIRHARPLVVRENFEVFPSALGGDRDHLLKPYAKWLDFARYLRGYLRLLIMKLRAWCPGPNPPG
jgi:glycosyl transferase family 25